MWLAEDAPIRKQDLFLKKPFVNAAGMLGFAPDPHTIPFLGRLGAFITNPVSRRPRRSRASAAVCPSRADSCCTPVCPIRASAQSFRKITGAGPRLRCRSSFTCWSKNQRRWRK